MPCVAEVFPEHVFVSEVALGSKRCQAFCDPELGL